MPYFLHEEALQPGQVVSFRGEEARHLLKSRRIRVGERFAVQDTQGRRFLAELGEQGGRDATITILESLPLPPPPRRNVTLIQAAVKDKAAELIVQKATEMGVESVVFFPSEHGSVPHKALNAPGANARWERIAWEACKQSERQFPPRMDVAKNLIDALKSTDETGGGSEKVPWVGWLLDPSAALGLAGALARLVESGSPVVRILVGPEGGLTVGESELARNAGFLPVAMGGTIQRAETAALAACALALFG